RQLLEFVFYTIRHSRKLVIVAGAGISVSAGIPDFRSSTGLFKTLKNDFKLKVSGQDMFDASVYRDAESAKSFQVMVHGLHNLCEKATRTAFHNLISEISTENRLLRLYTQNVDGLDASINGLETAVPLPLRPPWPKTVQLHGGLQTVVCSKCGWMGPFKPELFGDDVIPDCTECQELDSVRIVVGKRTQGIGKLRPRIVLYNEFNPDGEAIGKITSADLRSRPDGLLVVGTSLKIPGVRRIVREMSNAVHAAKGSVIWINNDDPPIGKEFDSCFDLIIKGDCQLLPGILSELDE
ncbi:DHS-like NAD/FAD-binding domain-containing protein, partial [Dipodascopsis tothii]|uniref:DHS-like NAD/FAD-binding domain-containing protein n=1 Tax=Dipodascopsis tothii TaxID=44089 RepID=UPI0034CD8FFF